VFRVGALALWGSVAPRLNLPPHVRAAFGSSVKDLIKRYGG
jgi:hypothetical protein